MMSVPLPFIHPMRDPVVSIVMPAFNAASFIGEAIRSVQAQTFADWELLVVDDRSGDDTALVAQEYATADPRIQLIRQDQNGGAARARNRATAVARGAFIAFLDADDQWLPDKLRVQLAAMQAADSAASCTAYAVVDGSGEKVRGVRTPPPLASYAQMLRMNRVGCLTFMYSVKHCGKHYMPEDCGQEDLVTWLGIIRRTGAPILGLPQVLARYRMTAGSVSANKRRTALRQWDVYRRKLKLGPAEAAFYFCCYAASTGVRALRERR
jgi:teichuronic acid biosynthesis glycosyltransferase TuaG